MKEVLEKIAAALRAGERVVLCTILAVAGSTPRNAGAKMAVFADGSFAGTIGGGTVEFEALQKARKALLSGKSGIEVFHLRHPADDGDPLCGGDVTVYFQLLCGENSMHRQRIDGMLESLGQPVNSWVITEIRRDNEWSCGIYDEKNGLRFLPDTDAAPLRQWMTRRAALTEGERQYLVEPLARAERLYVFGGGHVTQALVPVLTGVGFRVIVLENRREFADKSLFPTADQVVQAEFSELTRLFSVTALDGIVIMTRGHREDDQVLRQALETEAGYVGVIGSRRKAQLTLERLRKDGVQETDLRRIHSPIGLPIGAETPEEIAVSVAAELIAHRAGVLERR